MFVGKTQKQVFPIATYWFLHNYIKNSEKIYLFYPESDLLSENILLIVLLYYLFSETDICSELF